MNPLTRVVRRFTFEASHTIPNHPGKCKDLHGHSYKLEVEVTGHVVPIDGYFVDFSVIKTLVNLNVIDKLDHKHLNDIILPVASAENIVRWIEHKLQHDFEPPGLLLSRVRLYETENCYVEIIP